MEKILEIMDLESIDEFEYFENFADLVETAELITQDEMHAFAAAVDKKTLAGLIKSYFDELLDNLPGEAVDLYTLLNTIKTSLMGLAKNYDEDNNLVLLGEELLRFKNWYATESKVSCEELGSGETQELSVADAVAAYRASKFESREYAFDFENALDYPIDEYIVSLSDMVEEEYADEIPDEQAYVPDDYWKQREEY